MRLKFSPALDASVCDAPNFARVAAWQREAVKVLVKRQHIRKLLQIDERVAERTASFEVVRHIQKVDATRANPSRTNAPKRSCVILTGMFLMISVVRESMPDAT